MTPERWNQVCSLLSQALRLEPHEWETFLDENVEDPECRTELEPILQRLNHGRLVSSLEPGSPLPTVEFNEVDAFGSTQGPLDPLATLHQEDQPASRREEAQPRPSQPSSNPEGAVESVRRSDALNFEDRDLSRLLSAVTDLAFQTTDPQLRCPHCRQPIAPGNGPQSSEVTCLACGLGFKLEQVHPSSKAIPHDERRIDRYVLIERIGSGSFGTVFKAVDPQLGRKVAVKLLRIGDLATDEHRARFLREARNVAHLRHPLIVPVYDAGTDQGVPYIVSELVEGVTLAQFMTTSHLSFRQSARLMVDLADALQYAHENGVIHRDVKPSNVILDHSQRPHLMDFGVAKRDAAEVTMTLDGEVLGTPAYMSPEQARGDSHLADGKTDIYSLGVMLYQLLTGELPFRGNPRMIMQQVQVEEPRPPRALVDTIPRDLETICLTAMAKEPSLRYPSAKALAEDLGRFLGAEPILARPVSRLTKLMLWGRRNPRVAALSAMVYVLLVALAAGGASSFLRIRAAQSEARGHLVRLNLQNGNRLVQAGMTAAALPWMVQALNSEKDDPARETVHRLRISTLLRQAPRPVMSWALDGPIRAAEFDSTGTQILLAGGTQTLILDAATGHSRTPALQSSGDSSSAGPCRFASFNEDGSRAVTLFEKEARVWDAVSGKAISAPLVHGNLVESAALALGGKLLITSSQRRVYFWDLNSGQQWRQPLEHPDLVRQVVVSPDGQRLLTCFGGPEASIGGGWLWEISTSASQPVLRFPHEDDVYSGGFSPDGSLVFTGSYDQTAKVWDSHTGKPITLHPHHSTVLDGRFSHDGKRLVTVSEHEARVWHVGPSGGETITLTHQGDVLRAVWSRDGALLATCGTDRVARVWDSHTGELVFPPVGHNADVKCVAFSPDGRFLLTGSSDGLSRLWDLSAGNWPAQTYRHGMWVGHGELSPDGSHALTISRDGHCRLWDVDRQREDVVINHGHRGDYATYSHDGRLIATVGYDASVRIWDAATGSLVAGPLIQGPTKRRLFLSPDERIHVVQFDPTGRILLSYSSEEIAIWDWRAQSRIKTIRVQADHRFHHATFSPDGQKILVASSDGFAWLWPVEKDDNRAIKLAQRTPVVHGAFSHDGSRVLTCGGRSARVWEISTGRLLVEFPHVDQVNHGEFSRDDSKVVTASDDRTSGVWDAASGKLLTPFLAHEDRVLVAHFSADGQLVATGCGGEGVGQLGAARVWDATTGDFISLPWRHGTGVRNLAFSPDGHRLITVAYRDSTAKVWDLAPAAQRIASLEQLARLFAGSGIDDSGGSAFLGPVDLAQVQRQLVESDPTVFTATPSELVCWREEESRRLEKAQDWEAAVGCYGKLLKFYPDSSYYLSHRGLALAELGRWDEAKNDLSRAVEGGSEDLGVWNAAAVSSLWTKDVSSYQGICDSLLSQFGQIKDTWRSNGLALLCCLGENSPVKLNVALQLVDRLVVAMPQNSEFHSTLGAVLFRQGELDRAVDELKEAIRLNGNGGTLVDWLYLSLACRRMGHHEEAQRWLEKAEAKLQFDEEATKVIDGRQNTDLIPYKILYNEARKPPTAMTSPR